MVAEIDNSSFKPIALFISGTYSTWLEKRETDLSEIYDTVLEKIRTAIPEDFNQITSFNSAIMIWEKLGDLCDQLAADTDFSRIEGFETQELIEAWIHQFDGPDPILVDSVRLQIPEDFLKSVTTHSVITWFRKTLVYTAQSTKNRTARLVNWLKRAPYTQKKQERYFSSRNFGLVHAIVPFSTFMLDEKERALVNFRDTIFQLRQTLKTIAYQLLFRATDPQSWESIDKKQLEQSLKNSLPLSTFEHTFRAGSDERLSSFLENLETEWREKWDVAGTFLLPRKQFDRKRFTLAMKPLKHSISEKRKQWAIHFEGETDEWARELRLLKLDFFQRSLAVKTIDDISATVNQRLCPALEELIQALDQFVSQNEKSDLDKPPPQSGQALVQSFIPLTREIRNKILPEIVDGMVANKAVSTMTTYQYDILHQISTLPVTIRKFNKRDVENQTPQSTLNLAPLRSNIEIHIGSDFKSVSTQLIRELTNHFDSVLIQVSDLEQIIMYTLESTRSQLDTDFELSEITKAFSEGMIRAADKARNLITELTQAVSTTSQRIYDQTEAFSTMMERLIENDQSLDLQIKAKQNQYKQWFSKIWKIVSNQAVSIKQRVIGTIKSVIQKANSRLKDITNYLGFTSPDLDDEDVLQRQLAQSWVTIGKLPFIYQRLFKLDPLTDARFFTARDLELNKLKENLNAWQLRQYTTTAVIGERGTGKTSTVINFCNDIQDEIQCFWVSPERSSVLKDGIMSVFRNVFTDFNGSDETEFEAYLLTLKQPIVCVIKKIHLTFIKTIDGFDILETLLTLINRTAARVFWVVTCNQNSWEYLNKVIQIEKQFTSVITCSGLTPEETQTAILKRHQVSGYKLLFQSDKKIRSNRKYSRLPSEEEKQLFLKNRFFKQLQTFAEGNITLSILFWLIAIHSITENRILISSRVDLEFNFISHITPEEMFTLGALVQHEDLTCEEHALVFLKSTERSQGELKVLANRGILIEASDDRYKINLAVYRPLVQLLRRHQILI